MQNTKLQTLWNLCNELKEKRQELILQWRNSQSEIGAAQHQLALEFRQLRQHNHQLEEDISHLNEQLGFYHQHHLSQSAAPSADLSGFIALIDLERQYTALMGKYYQLKMDLFLLKFDILNNEDEAFLRQLGEVETPFLGHFEHLEQWGNDLLQSKADALEQGEFPMERVFELHQALDDFDTFHLDLDAQKEQLQDAWENAPGHEDEDLSAALAAKEQELAAMQKVYEQVHTEFEQIQASNQTLFEQCEQLSNLTQGLQEELQTMVVVEMDEDDDTLDEQADDSDEDGDDDNDDLTQKELKQAVKEGVLDKGRKHIVSVLKSRFTKIPRRIHYALKKIETHQKMDKLFDTALECDTIETFENHVEELVG